MVVLAKYYNNRYTAEVRCLINMWTTGRCRLWSDQYRIRCHNENLPICEYRPVPNNPIPVSF